MIILTILLCTTAIQAIEPLRPFRTNTSPTINGILDDPVWQQAPFETGFIIYHPDYGSPMSEDTKVWYAYDRENLYFAFKCYDSEPDKIKTSVTARDKIRPDDWICINLDTFNDQQAIYALYVNPAGIQMDSRATMTDEDLSIDVVWYSGGRIDNDGYSIELQIPFKSIRFSHKEPVEMGVIFERYISRKSEAGTYPALDPKWGHNFITQTRPLIYENVKHYRLVEILPAVTYANKSAIDQDKLKTEKDKGEFSLTGKYGITSHLVFDGTINPDFSQVEADAGQVEFNQRFALYYEEKRPFFLEGRENFIFGGHTEGDPLGAIVHTRTIVDPMVGLKLTGKIGKKNTLASIYAMDELLDNQQQGDYAHISILRYKRALTQDSFIGGFCTGRKPDKGYNTVVGSDGQIRINRSSHIEFHGFLSNSDSLGLKKKNGHALGLKYYYLNRDWHTVARLHDLSQDFNTETGYVTRAGITRMRVGVIRMLYPKSNVIKRIDPLMNNQFIWDKESEQWEHSNEIYLSFLFPRSSSIRLGFAYSHEIFLEEKFNTSNVTINGSSQFTRQLYFDFYFRYGKKIRYSYDPAIPPYQGKGSLAEVNMVYQPSGKFNSTFGFTFSDLYRDDDNEKIFNYPIVRSKNTYQFNKYLFFRIILEYTAYDNYEKDERSRELTTDFLISFTYIPGTVIHLGYGSLYDKIKWENDNYVDSDRFLETQRGFFFKTSYLWRM